jgi:DNA polymerase III subunit epsilon
MSAIDSPGARGYVASEFPSRSTPWRKADYIVVDLEMTGLDPATDEIISYATIPIVEGRVRPGEVCYRLVRPRRMPDGETIRIHGLRESDLIGAPTLVEVLDDLLKEMAGRVLVAHVAPVEEGFLRAALASHGLTFRNPIIDTAAVGLELHRRAGTTPPDGPPISLTDLARSLGLPAHRLHHADGDALTTAQIFLALATRLERFMSVTVGALEDTSRPPTLLSRIQRRFRRPRLAASAN